MHPAFAALLPLAMASPAPARTQVQGTTNLVWTHPVLGKVEFQNRETSDLPTTVGGARGRPCQVSRIAGQASQLLADVRGGLERFGHTLEPSRSGVQANGAQAETVQAVISDPEFIVVQFIHATVRGKPMASFQIKDMKL